METLINNLETVKAIKIALIIAFFVILAAVAFVEKPYGQGTEEPGESDMDRQ